jgi:hypothetical protein
MEVTSRRPAGMRLSADALSQPDHLNSSDPFCVAGTPVLEPFQEMFQWCSMAINGYARVDPNQ